MLPHAGSNVEHAATISVAGSDDRSDRAGTSDGRYTLRRELARGGMGRIWVADDAQLLATDRTSASLQIDVIDALGRLGETLERAGQQADAVTALERALVMAEAIGTSNPRWDEIRSERRATLARVRKKR